MFVCSFSDYLGMTTAAARAALPVLPVCVFSFSVYVGKTTAALPVLPVFMCSFSVYLGNPTAVARAALPSPIGVCGV